MCAALYEASVPVLLWRKAKKLRRETYNPYLHTHFDNDTSVNISARFQTAFSQPFRLMNSPSLFVPSSLSAVGIAFLYVLYITLSETSMPVYVWPRKSWGLIYLGVAMSVILVIIVAALGVTFYERLFGKDEGKGPEKRLIPLLLYWPLAGIGLILYGFSIYKKTHWVGPLFSSGLAGAGILGTVVSDLFSFYEHFIGQRAFHGMNSFSIPRSVRYRLNACKGDAVLIYGPTLQLLSFFHVSCDGIRCFGIMFIAHSLYLPGLQLLTYCCRFPTNFTSLEYSTMTTPAAPLLYMPAFFSKHLWAASFPSSQTKFCTIWACHTRSTCLEPSP